MSLVLSGTDGLSDIDGSAATPAIRGTDANTGIFFPAADTIAFAEGGAEIARFDSSGNLGIGTTTPTQRLHLAQAGQPKIEFEDITNSSKGRITTGGTTGSMVFDADPDNTKAGTVMTFNVDATERARIDSSGILLVGTTTTTGDGVAVFPNLDTGGSINVRKGAAASGARFIIFDRSGSQIGSISQNGTTQVLYNISSDYRLKNDQQPLTGAKEFVMALQPKKWQWWDGSGEGVGFIAHEFMEVAKHSGNGEKDAVDAEGKPIMQSIQPSSSEVMANLVAFIQEQQALIQSLTDRITALETA
jgi:hypothetical protein